MKPGLYRSPFATGNVSTAAGAMSAAEAAGLRAAEQAAAVVERVATLEAQIAAALTIHHTGSGPLSRRCVACTDQWGYFLRWPCPTAAALGVPPDASDRCTCRPPAIETTHDDSTGAALTISLVTSDCPIHPKGTS